MSINFLQPSGASTFNKKTLPPDRNYLKELVCKAGPRIVFLLWSEWRRSSHPSLHHTNIPSTCPTSPYCIGKIYVVKWKQSHNLAIEKGRFSGITREQRLCSCNTDIQTIDHVILHCPLLTDVRVRCGITDVETGVMDDKFLVEMEMLLGVKWIMNFECLEFYDLLKIWLEYFLWIFMCSVYYLTFRCGLLLLFTPHELYATFLFYEHFRFWSLLMQSMFFLLYSLGYPFI